MTRSAPGCMRPAEPVAEIYICTSAMSPLVTNGFPQHETHGHADFVAHHGRLRLDISHIVHHAWAEEDLIPGFSLEVKRWV